MRRALLFTLLAVAASGRAHAQRASYEELQTFSTVLNLVRLNHVDTVSYTPLVRAAIEGALGAVDPHSRYVRRQAEAALIAARAGERASAGVELDALRNLVTVLAVGRGSPAEAAGMLSGDRIVSVQDSSVAGLAAHDVELLLSGERGVERRVGLERGDPLNAIRLDVVVRLDRYVWPDVTTPMMLSPDAGYVRLGGFGMDAAHELEQALAALRKSGMRRLVLDLRANPGGLLSEAVDVAALFLPKDQLVMRTVGRRRGTSGEYRTRSSGDYRDLPMVVLVDGSSASAAEALAGALQDHGRARIAGHRTFGKALVQMPFPLPDGDVLWLTVARVHTPDGRMIQRSYDGLSAGQYAAAAEALRRGGREAAADGSGGIEPDTYFIARPQMPSWWLEARTRKLDILAAQRADIPPGGAPDGSWREQLLLAFRSIAIEEMGAAPAASAEQEDAIARHLTRVAIATRTGQLEAEQYVIRTDPEIGQALLMLDEMRAAP